MKSVMKNIRQSSVKRKNIEKWKKSIRMMKSERIDAEKDEINEEKGRKIEANKKWYRK